MNLERPLQSPDSLLCQLPALITCRWVPGFGVYIRYLTLPLLPLAVNNRQTWAILKLMPLHSQSRPISYALLWTESWFPERELITGLCKLIIFNTHTLTHTDTGFQCSFCWLFAKVLQTKSQTHMHTNSPKPPPPRQQNTFLALCLHLN